MAYGQNSKIGIMFQDSYHTHVDSMNFVASSVYWIPHLSDTIKLNIPPLYSENMRGIYDEGDSYEGAKTVDGDLQSEAQPIAVGAMLKTALELTGSINVGSAYQHTFKPRTTEHSELSANNPFTHYAYLDTGSSFLHHNLNASMLELGIANGEFFKAKITVAGGWFSQVAPSAASYDVGKRWTWDTASLSLGGAGVSEIQNMTITMDEALEPVHTLNNSKYPSSIKRQDFRTFAVDGTIKFRNQVEYQEFIDQSERPLDITFTGPTEVASGYYDTFRIRLPAMRYEEYGPTAEGPGEIEASFTARGKYHVGSATGMEITLVNTQATY